MSAMRDHWWTGAFGQERSFGLGAESGRPATVQPADVGVLPYDTAGAVDLSYRQFGVRVKFR